MKSKRTPPTCLLVALDGSHLAETVLPLVIMLAKALDAQVTLVHVLEQEAPATIHGEPHLTTAKDAETYLSDVAERLREAGLTVHTHLHANPQRDVAASIADHAAEMDADLIVLAAHGGGGLREWLVGRIPQLVAAKAGRPVMIVPAPSRRDLSAIERIMLPVDPAGEVKAAIPLTRRLAKACDAEVVLVTVIPTLETLAGGAGAAAIFLPGTTSSLLNWAEQQAHVTLDQLAGELRKEGIAVATDVRRGDPAHELVKAITDYGVDLVVMATHARAGWDAFWTGSVAPQVVGHMQCPLLLVPISA